MITALRKGPRRSASGSRKHRHGGRTGRTSPSRSSTTPISRHWKTSRRSTTCRPARFRDRRSPSGRFAGPGTPAIGRATCEDEAYRSDAGAAGRRLRDCVARGDVRHVAATRGDPALDRFRDIYGHDTRFPWPTIPVRRVDLLGYARTTGPARAAYQVMTVSDDEGHCQVASGRPGLLGTHCRARVRFVRNFTSSTSTPLLRAPRCQYHDRSART